MAKSTKPKKPIPVAPIAAPEAVKTCPKGWFLNSKGECQQDPG